jgi:hypothetical protein
MGCRRDSAEGPFTPRSSSPTARRGGAALEATVLAPAIWPWPSRRKASARRSIIGGGRNDPARASAHAGSTDKPDRTWNWSLTTPEVCTSWRSMPHAPRRVRHPDCGRGGRPRARGPSPTLPVSEGAVAARASPRHVECGAAIRRAAHRHARGSRRPGDVGRELRECPAVTARHQYAAHQARRAAPIRSSPAGPESPRGERPAPRSATPQGRARPASPPRGC